MSAQQKKHPFDFKTQYGLGFNPQDDEIVVDFFCGGGGAGTGLEIGLGRTVNVAKNHSPQAISMHTVNHPGAVHYTTDVFDGDPDTECGGKAVGWFHMSPDCTHHSQAAGGQPRKREIRNLSWIGLKWAGKKRPRVISLENVKQILQWGPLVAKRDKVTGCVVKLGGGIAAPGEVVPVHQQFLVPDPKRRGQTWAVFVAELQRLGYAVEWRVLKACDHGAPTSRERLFMIARCDGQPIVWPEPTHAKNPAKGQKKWRTAAECIDWTIPSKSIFDRPKPLAPATLRRIAKGMKKFVLDAADPFIVPIANWSGESVQSAHEPLRTVTSWPRGGSFAMASPIIAPATHQGSDRVNDPNSPLPTVTCANRGELTLISPTLIQTGYGERTGQEPRVPGIDQPLGTVVAGGVKHALTGAVLVGAGGPEYSGKPASVDQPAGTLMTQNHRAIAAAHLVKFRFADEGKALDEPLPTITSGGNYQRPAGAAHAMGMSTVFMAQMNGGFNTTVAKSITDPMTTVTNTGSQQQLVELQLSPEVEAGALRVAAFLISYYGTENISGADAPAPTITTKDRLGLVTVTIRGTPYVIVDICLRMLQPSELYKAQGFPADYIIDRGADGKPFTKTQQVHMCGNSVSPPPMAALARANDPWRVAEQQSRAA
ncbi:DNA cytosine methyltransferase [Pseudomonas chlororaphis]|uniref:DNA cytosine methyltransferase n=1 Tax=Pseudomonas chlororaphis TaxID=587753 RepID=UPI001231980C|nr:DNA cytosine methyltransferase [Pseudomonas chlororaphis]KAA5842300.1 DNA cytosine methyltransferase [Pseudomonas chlororaphis]